MEEKTITDFCNNEYISFASYDVYRKIANVIDGLKVSARKILYTCIEDNKQDKLKKVEALSNRAAEFTDYHHGSTSLVGVIVGMAQRYVGSNNIPLLKADGQFGIRLIPDAAAPRYIFTCKETYINSLFNVADNNILEKQYSDGQEIEPKFYVPVLPMLLVNGAVGLSVGFAQNILPRNPIDLIKYINRKLNNQNCNNPLLPYWRGFKGEIKEVSPGVYDIYGIYKLEKGKIIISEIPIGIKYKKYIDILDNLIEEGFITSYKDFCDTQNDSILFELKLSPAKYQEIIQTSDIDLYTILKLKTRETENYTCLDENGLVKTFKNIQQIFDYYIDIRLKYYVKRKQYILNKLTTEIKLLCSKFIFIKNIIDEKIDIKNKPTSFIIDQLQKYDKIIKEENSYNYLLKMPIYSMTKEKLEELKEKIGNIKNTIDLLKHQSEYDIWNNDLEEIKKWIK